MHFFATKKLLENTKLYPRIPETCSNKENSTIPRICVSKSIIGAISSTYLHMDSQTGDCIYVYACNPDPADVMQPGPDLAPDGYLHGEEWILSPIGMDLYEVFKVEKEKTGVCIGQSQLILAHLFSEYKNNINYDIRLYSVWRHN